MNAKDMAAQEDRVQSANNRMGAIQRRLSSTKKSPASQSADSTVDSRKQVGY